LAYKYTAVLHKAGNDIFMAVKYNFVPGCITAIWLWLCHSLVRSDYKAAFTVAEIEAEMICNF